MLDLGDRVNFLHVVGKKVEPGLAEFLADQMKPVFRSFDAAKGSRLLAAGEGGMGNLVGGIVRDAAWKTLHQFVGHVLKVAERTVSRDDIEEFRKDLAKTSPFVAQGLEFILQGHLDSPPADGEVEGRNLRREYSDSHRYSDYRGGSKGYKDDYGYSDSHKGYSDSHRVYSDSHKGYSDYEYEYSVQPKHGHDGGYGGYGSYDGYGASHQVRQGTGDAERQKVLSSAHCALLLHSYS